MVDLMAGSWLMNISRTAIGTTPLSPFICVVISSIWSLPSCILRYIMYLLLIHDEGFRKFWKFVPFTSTSCSPSSMTSSRRQTQKPTLSSCNSLIVIRVILIWSRRRTLSRRARQAVREPPTVEASSCPFVRRPQQSRIASVWRRVWVYIATPWTPSPPVWKKRWSSQRMCRCLRTFLSSCRSSRVMRNPEACPPLCPSPRECIILPLLQRLLSVHCTRSSSESKSPSRDCISLYAFPLVRDQTRFAYCLLMLTITVFMNITCPSTMIFWITFCMPLNSS